MEIIENLAQWEKAFENGWLAHYQKTGETDWKQYVRVKNEEVPAGPGIDLAQSRLVLISTAGGYLPSDQAPFDAADDLGDYTIRLFPLATPFAELAFAHDHYDHTAVNSDPQVLLPLRHLEEMVAEGKIGEMAPMVISYCGYQPDVRRIKDKLIPAVLENVRAQEADGALLVPA